MDVSSRFVILADGPAVPVEPVRLLMDLQDRGFTLRQDGDALVVHPHQQLTSTERKAITRWRWHLLMLLDYQPPVIA